MKRLVAAILLACTCFGLALAQAKAPAAATPPQGPNVSDAIKQLERDWFDAQKPVILTNLA